MILGGAQLVHDGAVGGQDLGPVGDDQGGIFVKAVVGQDAADGQLVWVGGRLLRGGIAQDQAASVVGGGGRHVIGDIVQGHVVHIGLLRVGQNVLHVLFYCGLTPQGQGVLVVHVGLGNGLEGVVQDDHAAYVLGVDELLQKGGVGQLLGGDEFFQPVRLVQQVLEGPGGAAPGVVVKFLALGLDKGGGLLRHFIGLRQVLILDHDPHAHKDADADHQENAHGQLEPPGSCALNDAHGRPPLLRTYTADRSCRWCRRPSSPK